MKKRIAFMIDTLAGGGAERVVSVLSQELIKRGYCVDIVLTQKKLIQYTIPKEVNVYFLPDFPDISTSFKLIRVITRIKRWLGRTIYSLAQKTVIIDSNCCFNDPEVRYLLSMRYFFETYVKRNRPGVVVGFLVKPNIIMLSKLNIKGIKRIFCERNSPVRPDIPVNIIRARDKLCSRADAAVFQTNEQMEYYTNIEKKFVIPNPLKESLPERYIGDRKKEIVTFGRLDPQKNLLCLIEAFELFLANHSDYILHIYGNGSQREELERVINQKKLESSVCIDGFQNNIHELVVDAAMYVSTSDFEGLSNSMLEAMAIGLPVVCTDCDGGGSRMIIHDCENGLIVPKGDARAVADAMSKIADSKKFSDKLSTEASKLRDQLSVESIVSQWIVFFEEL